MIQTLCERKQGTDSMDALKNLIVMSKRSDITDEMQKAADAAGIKLYAFEEVVEAGAKERKERGPLKVVEPTPDSVYMLSYTSGTTGNPKGVKLTQRMILAAA